MNGELQDVHIIVDDDGVMVENTKAHDIQNQPRNSGSDYGVGIRVH